MPEDSSTLRVDIKQLLSCYPQPGSCFFVGYRTARRNPTKKWREALQDKSIVFSGLKLEDLKARSYEKAEKEFTEWLHRLGPLDMKTSQQEVIINPVLMELKLSIVSEGGYFYQGVPDDSGIAPGKPFSII